MYGDKDKYSEGNLILSSFSKIIVVGSRLGPMTSPGKGPCLGLQYLACVSFCGMSFKSNQWGLVTPISCLSHLYQWS